MDVKYLERKGFTLVEIMIVVAVMGLLAAIAIPHFMRSRQAALTNTCIANLKQIDSAKDSWALDNNQPETAIPNMFPDLVTTYLQAEPKCGTNTYVVNAVNTKQICPSAGANPSHSY